MTLLQQLEQLAIAICDTNHDFLFRGSFVSRIWMGPYQRQCQDLDLMVLGDFDESRIRQSITHLLPVVQGHHISFTPIWQDSIAPGLRAEISTETDTIIQIDVSAADPMVAPAINTTIALSTGGTLTVPTPSLETATAWKLHGLFEHLNGPWTSKTLWDLYVFCRYNDLDSTQLKAAAELAFSSRLDPLVILRRLLYGDFGSSRKSLRGWDKDIAPITNGNYLPLPEVLAWVSDYLTPILAITNDGSLLNQAEVISYRVKHLRKNGSPAALNKLKTLSQKRKILPHKAYSSMPHLPGSRLGPSEKTIDDNKVAMLTQASRYPTDQVIVQEKLDGSCVCAYRKNDHIFALGRAGDLADESPNESRRLWAQWVADNEERFMRLLSNGERVVGEWLAMAHGTRYRLEHEPFVLFDLFTKDNVALSLINILNQQAAMGVEPFITPHLYHQGAPIAIPEIDNLIGRHGQHGATDPAEGAIWRLERDGRVLFRAKYVRANKVDGSLLEENTQQGIVWNWHP